MYSPNYLSWHQTRQERQHGTKQKNSFFGVNSLYPPTFLGTSKPRNVNMEQSRKKRVLFLAPAIPEDMDPCTSGPRYKLFTKKNCFLLCSMLTLVPRKVSRRIRTIIPIFSMLRSLWWIVLSALYCLRAWWMNVPWKQDRLLGGGSFFLAKMLHMSTFKNRKHHTNILEFGRDLILGALEKVNMDQGKALRKRTSAWP